MPRQLTVENHDRDVAGLAYVYPVVSRRARGVSVGVNLNPNDACNWRCVYCQVPGLTKGAGPPIDLALLERELSEMIGSIVAGDYLEKRVPEGFRRLNDVALSGNGEPTTSPDFVAAIEVIERVLAAHDLVKKIRVVLITNGSMIGREEVDRGLEKLGRFGGEVWFKLDAATREGLLATNSVKLDPERHLFRLRQAAELCPTYVQTCVFAVDGEPPSDAERQAYLDTLASTAREGTPLRGVLLYGLARPSHQPEAPRLSNVPEPWLEAFARDIEALGLDVQLSA